MVIVSPTSGYEAALEAANDTPFGLSAAIFTRDLGRAMSFAREIESGQVHINRETAGAEPQAPFGGLKGSSNHAARAGQGGEAVLHQLEDRLRPRPLTLPRSLAHALQRQPRRAARLGDPVLRPLGALIGAPELG